MPLITFGRFGNKKDFENDRVFFLKNLNELYTFLTTGEEHSKDQPYKNELEIVKPLKPILKRRENSWFFKTGYCATLTQFLKPMGLTYETLTKKEIEEILDMDFTFENWEKKSLELLNNYIERSKNICPRMVWFCFEDIFFVLFVRIDHETSFTLDNFIGFIRDYFILDDCEYQFGRYRDPTKFNDIQKRVIDIYPILKEK